jgi:hypothetical protein
MKWITRERPKIDRVACPWLISRFVDPDAEFLFVQAAQVEAVAQELDAEPYPPSARSRARSVNAVNPGHPQIGAIHGQPPTHI